MSVAALGAASRRSFSSLPGRQGIWTDRVLGPLPSFCPYQFKEEAPEKLQPCRSRRCCFSSCPSVIKNAWGKLKQRQVEKLLPSIIFDEQLPPHVFLGKEILQMEDSDQVERLSSLIDSKLEAAACGRSISSLSLRELEELDWSLLTAVKVASPEVSVVAQYLLHAPCKRFRPLLLLLVNRALLACAQREQTPKHFIQRNRVFLGYPGQDRPLCSGEATASTPNTAMPLIMVQVAELIHTASLIHDDVLDEAPTRRGRPAAHSVFGNKKAILGGDFVLARANSIAASAGSPEVCLRISQVVESLVKGELLQALSNNSDIPKAFETMLAKSYHKTASLMAETCACLALIGGYTREWVDWCHEMGASIGLAFQLYDDELDLLASTQDLGKPANNDLKTGVVTAPLLLAALEHPRELLPLLKRKLSEPGDPELAVEKIRNSAALPRARLLSRLYIQHILRLLERLPQKFPEQQDAAADLASLVLWVMRRRAS